MKDILIGGAWVYANGSLHIGHVASLLPGDVLARYHRAAGDNVCYVSGSDCHGTPVAIRARQEGRAPEEISDHYHEEFKYCFEKLGFSYDAYLKTSSETHKNFVRDFHRRLYKSDYVYEKETPQAFCKNCNAFLADRFVTGKCPQCGADTRGDQCDACGTVLSAEELTEPRCAVCEGPVTYKSAKHLYIAVSKMEKEIKALADGHPEWRKNAIAFTNRYIQEGLRDRALTRDLAWGIPVPWKGYEEKTIYIWAENVLGYLSASRVAVKEKYRAGEEKKKAFEKLWGENARHYYVHGKDNIPFHTIILPALLIAEGGHWHLPDRIVSSEYMTLEGRKISTSQNYAVWIKDLLGRYDADSIRYYFLANVPEKKDADFSWREYVACHNGELLGAYGNFVNRSLSFIVKYWDGIVPEGVEDPETGAQTELLFKKTGELIEKGAIKDAVRGIFEFVHAANKFFDSERPWVTRVENEEACKNTLFQCVQMIANLAVLLYPFLPFSSEKICRWLQTDHTWQRHFIPGGLLLPKIEILFQRIDKAEIEKEVAKLGKK